MKRSKQIALTLIASTYLMAGGCSDQEEVNAMRQLYSSRDGCIQDWGDDDCEDQPDGSSYSPHFFYSGGRPYYFPRNRHEPVEVEPHKGFSRYAPGTTSSHVRSVMSSTRTVRGGFGHSASFHSGGS